MLVTGNPRTDQFWRPVDPDALARARHHRRLRGVDADLPPDPGGRGGAGAVRDRATRGDGRPRAARRRCSTACASAGSSSSSSRTRWTPSDRRWDGAVTVTEDDLVARRGEPLRPARRRRAAWSPTTRACGSTTCCSTGRWPSWSPTGDSYTRGAGPGRRPRLGCRASWSDAADARSTQFLADLDAARRRGRGAARGGRRPDRPEPDAGPSADDLRHRARQRGASCGASG